MSRQQAADLLNVEVDASRAEIQQAFRRAARDAHPDAGPSDTSVSLQNAQEARDVLLGQSRWSAKVVGGPRPWPPPGTPRASASRATAQQFVDSSDGDGGNDAGPDFADQLRDLSERGANWLVMITLAIVVVIFLIVGAILAIGAIFGSDAGADGENPKRSTEAECVAVSNRSVAPVECSEPNAQRIVAKTDAVITCPPGQNTLVVGGATWCLEFATS